MQLNFVLLFVHSGRLSVGWRHWLKEATSTQENKVHRRTKSVRLTFVSSAFICLGRRNILRNEKRIVAGTDRQDRQTKRDEYRGRNDSTAKKKKGRRDTHRPNKRVLVNVLV